MSAGNPGSSARNTGLFFLQIADELRDEVIHCDQLEEEIRNSRLVTKTGKTLKKGLLILAGAIGGILLTVATQWVLSRLNLK